MKKIFILTGEPSGDKLASTVISRLKLENSEIKYLSVGGSNLKNLGINTIFDLLWSLPRDTIDRTNLVKINELQIGKVQTLTINVKKYNFPRIRNLPNRVQCEDDTGKLECIFFNSYEGYIKKILPLGSNITILSLIHI